MLYVIARRFRESLGLFFTVTETHAGSEEIKEKSRCRQPRVNFRIPNEQFLLTFKSYKQSAGGFVIGRVEGFFMLKVALLF